MSEILDKVNDPGDVKRLNQDELSELCSELRELLVSRVSENGGHLASNLGVVELAVALHRVFDSPKDKIVWDVGHQSYVHKLLTGRREQFSSLRQYQGLSGFPDRNESPHDAFTTGHGGTSISAALGMALTRTVGAIARWLNVVRTTRGYMRAKKKTSRFLSLLPGGKKMQWALRRLKEGAKAVVMPIMMWEQQDITREVIMKQKREVLGV